MAENQEGPILAKWECHKIVAAGKITRLTCAEHGTQVFALGVLTADGTEAEVCPGDAFFARGTPALGDYLVRYEDGYMSWSPAKAFESGYTQING